MRKVIGIGETILDIIFKNNQPTKALPGGSVFNAMISLGRLHTPVCFITELGQDRVGEMIQNFMHENNVTTEYVDIFCDGKSPASLAFLKEDNRTEYMFYNQYPESRLNVVWPRIDADDILITEPSAGLKFDKSIFAFKNSGVSRICPNPQSYYLL